MRIGATILLSDKKCIQSYSWSRLRPLGSLQNVLDSLEEYQCDEITIIRPVREIDTIDDFKADLCVLKSVVSMTPISFGGGIRSFEHLSLLKGLPVERLVFSSAFLNGDEKLIEMATNLFGPQAIQCLLPLCWMSGKICVFNSAASSYVPISNVDLQFINSFANEIIIIDIHNEGKNNSFDWSLIDALPFPNSKIIISGGIGEQCSKQSIKYGLASVLVDNKILHKEYSISRYKHAAILS